MIRNKIVLAVAAASVLLTGCSGSTNSSEWDRITDDNQKYIDVDFVKQMNLFQPKRDKTDYVKDDYFVSLKSLDVVTDKRANLPTKFFKSAYVYAKNGLKVSQITDQLYTDFNLNVEISEHKPGSTSTDANASNPNLQLTGEDSDDEGNEINYRYTGDIAGLLDYIGVAIDKKWDYDVDNDKIYFYKFNTKKFKLTIPISEITTDMSISSDTSSSSEGSSSGTSQSITVKKEVQVWDDIQEGIKTLIGPEGVVAFDLSDQSVLVTDTDYNLSLVSGYVKEMNENYKRQVAIEVNMINVVINDTNSFGVNWSSINSAVSSTMLGRLSTGFNMGSNVPMGNTINVTNTSGMGILLDTLSEFATASVENTISAVTVNGGTVPVQKITETSYIARTSVTTTSDTSSTETQIEKIKEGVTLTVTPTIHDQLVMIDYNIQLTSIDSMNEVSVGRGDDATTITTPSVSSKIFSQKVMARNGQPIIVASFAADDKSTVSRSPFTKALWFLGGNQKRESTQERVLIVVTPHIVSGD